jgi:hypothetical protein
MGGLQMHRPQPDPGADRLPTLRAVGPEGGPPTDRSPGTGISPVAWEPHHDLQLREWLEHGRRFGALGRGMAWWIGDWIRYGNSRYGEKYTRAARVTGYDVQSLMNMAYVAARFESPRRRAALSWSHHAEVVALCPADQDAWLDLAERERLSVRSLRLELRATRRRQELPEHRRQARSEPPAHAEQLVCPHCRHVIDPAAKRDVAGSS